MVSTLSNAIDFFEKFGMFDIILPFLLVFTVVFAILEKTRILGEEDGQPRKNLNSMVAFVIGLFVVATVRVVEVIRESLPNIALVMIIAVSFLMLFGVFWGTEELKFEKGWQRTFVFVIMFFVVLGIFFSAIGWLDWIVGYVEYNWDKTVVPTLILFVILIGAIFYIVGGETKSSGKGGK